jgi:hypothetical protein
LAKHSEALSIYYWVIVGIYMVFSWHRDYPRQPASPPQTFYTYTSRREDNRFHHQLPHIEENKLSPHWLVAAGLTSPKHHSSIYFSLDNGPLLNGSITLNSNVGGIPSWFQYIVPCHNQCAYVPGTLSDCRPSRTIGDPSRRSESSLRPRTRRRT